MAVVAATAMILALWRPVEWLALVAVFSFYSAFSGYRALFRKRPHAGEAARVGDWLAAVVTLPPACALSRSPSSGRRHLGADLDDCHRPRPAGHRARHPRRVSFAWPSRNRQAWWFSHMGGMLGSYVATVSAFSAVNFTFLPLTLASSGRASSACPDLHLDRLLPRALHPAARPRRATQSREDPS